MQKPTVLVVGGVLEKQFELDMALQDVAEVTYASEGVNDVQKLLADHPAVVLVYATPGARLEMVERLSSAGARVVVVGPAKDPDLILAAMHAGAREFVVETDQDGVRRAVREQARPAEDGATRGMIVTVFPTRGGVGATTVAANLAGALQRGGERTCLVDLDLHLGDALAFLDLPGSYSISDVLGNLGRLDRELLDASVMRHPSGLRVLAQAGKVEEADRVHAADIGPMLDFLGRHYDRVVVDGVRGFDEMSLAALDASQRIVLLLSQDVPAVRNAKRCLDLFRRLGYGEARMQIVLNRYDKSSKITSDVVSDTLGLPVTHTLANDYAASIGAINSGLMLTDAAPRARLTGDIEKLAPLVTGRQKEPVRRGLLGALLGRRQSRGSSRAA